MATEIKKQYQEGQDRLVRLTLVPGRSTKLLQSKEMQLPPNDGDAARCAKVYRDRLWLAPRHGIPGRRDYIVKSRGGAEDEIR